jgi:hypothetical protein
MEIDYDYDYEYDEECEQRVVYNLAKPTKDLGKEFTRNARLDLPQMRLQGNHVGRQNR